MQENIHPRQRLINMMYLVLLALLALNIQIDFIDAFFDLSTSIEQSVKKFDVEKDQKMLSIQQAYELDSLSYFASFQKSNQAKLIANNAVHYIDSLKSLLIKKTGGFNKYGYPINSMDPKIPDNIFLQRKGAKYLKEKLQETKEKLQTILPKNQQYILYNIYNVPDYIINSRGINLSWEEYHFNNLALGGVLAILSGFKNDVRMMESTILNYYINVIYGNLSSFIVANSTDSVSIEMSAINAETFDVGDEIKIKILLPKFKEINKTKIVLLDSQNEEIKKVKIDEQEKQLTFKAEKVGNYTIKATLLSNENKVLDEVKQKFNIVNPNKVEYLIIDEVIISKNQKILFLGIKNEININHPLYTKQQLTLTTNNGSIKRKGDVFYLVAERTGYAVVRLLNKKNKIAERTFQVRNLPDPIATMSGLSHTSMSSKFFRIQSSINLEVKGFNFDNAYKIESFELIRLNSKGDRIFAGENISAYFSGSISKQVKEVKKGDSYIFNQILVKSIDGRSRYIPSLIVKIK